MSFLRWKIQSIDSEPSAMRGTSWKMENLIDFLLIQHFLGQVAGSNYQTRAVIWCHFFWGGGALPTYKQRNRSQKAAKCCTSLSRKSLFDAINSCYIASWDSFVQGAARPGTRAMRRLIARSLLYVKRRALILISKTTIKRTEDEMRK